MRFRPEHKLLFITGYAGNAAPGNVLLAPVVSRLTKRFAVGALLGKVQAMAGKRCY